MADSKKTIFMVLGGCGCMMAVIGIIFVAAIIMGVGVVETTLEQNGLGGISELRESLEGLDAPESGATPKAMEKVESIRDKMDPDSVDAEVIATESRKPFSDADRTEYLALLEHLEQTDAFDEAVDQLEQLEENKDGPSSPEKGVLEQLGEMKTALDAYKAARDLIIEFDAEVKRTGGYPAHYGRLTRIAGVLAAARANAVNGDPASDATAKKLLELQPEVARETDEIEKKLAELGKSDDPSKAQQGQKVAMSAFMKPDQIALGHFPRESFEVWADLSKSDRAQLLELHDRKNGVWGVMAGGNLTRGDAFLMMSGLKKLDRFKDETKK